MMADLGVENKGGREGNFPRGQRGTEKEGREEFGTRGSDVLTGNGPGIKANKGSAWALNPTREGACAPRTFAGPGWRRGGEWTGNNGQRTMRGNSPQGHRGTEKEGPGQVRSD